MLIRILRAYQGESYVLKGKCPACRKRVALAKGAKIKDLVTCPNCKTVLEITRKFPPVLDWAEDTMTSSYLGRIRNRF